MPTLEERVAFLEGKIGDVAHLTADVHDLREEVRRLSGRIDALDQKVDSRIDALDQKIDSRIDALDQKIDRFRNELSDRINTLDQKFDTRINALDQKVDRLYLFILGAFVASVGSLIGVIMALMRLPR